MGAPWSGRLLWMVGRFAAALAWVGGRLLPLDRPLLRGEAFRAFWLSRLTAQAAQNALLYGLLIVVVDRTDDPFYTSLFVGCSILPSLLVGLPAGLAVDALPRRPLLVALNLVRAALGLLLVLGVGRSLTGLFAVTLGLWTVHQFYAPAEGTTAPALVTRDRYGEAQALANLALVLAQLIGMVVLAPLLLRTAGPEALFALCAALFLGAAALAAVLPAVDERLGGEAPPPHGTRPEGAAGTKLLGGWRATRADRAVFEAMADDVMVGVGLSALVVIVPFYLERVLGTAKENTVFVFAPAALGTVLGLRAAPAIGRLLDERRAATAGLLAFSLGVAALGVVEQLQAVLDARFGGQFTRLGEALGVPPLVLVAMLVSIPAGFAAAVVGVAARAVLLARAPAAALAQVVAVQGVLGNLGALGPTLLVGLGADWLGVRTMAVVIAVAMVAGALAVRAAGRLAPPTRAARP